jgi:hypothetical protein
MLANPFVRIFPILRSALTLISLRDEKSDADGEKREENNGFFQINVRK